MKENKAAVKHTFIIALDKGAAESILNPKTQTDIIISATFGAVATAIDLRKEDTPIFLDKERGIIYKKEIAIKN